jgi:hypothetical protein
VNRTGEPPMGLAGGGLRYIIDQAYALSPLASRL